MKKILIPMMLVMLTVLVSVAMADQTAKPKVLYGTYVSTLDVATSEFTVNFWMEKFEGGGPGEEGNVLFAAGQGFIFKDATLADKECTFPTGQVVCTTTYIGGELLLNSEGPWIKKEKDEHKQGGLRATDITAINTSTLNTSTGELNFTLTFSGSFDNNDAACYSVIAEYLGTPILIPDASNPILQKDDLFTEVTIDIQKCGKSKGKD